VSCDVFHAMLSAYVDGELASQEKAEVAAHISACEKCRTQEKTLRNLSAMLHQPGLRQPAPPHLKKALSAALRKEYASDSDFWSWMSSPLKYALPSLALGIAFGWFGLMYTQQNTRNDLMLQSLTSAHIRSLMVDHLVDVVSSDSHTVKPWFHGRLDFSPPVHDLASEGFPLIGGRLDYLSGRTAAVMVYRHREHEINLFVLPLNADTSQSNSMEYDGYQVMHWRDKYFSYWAVSDLNPSDLNRFKDLLLQQ
jgi:anti-sigma factor RsiW